MDDLKDLMKSCIVPTVSGVAGTFIGMAIAHLIGIL